MTRILGLDPGLVRTGWGVVEVRGAELRFVAAGVVRVPTGGPLAARLLALHRALGEVLETWRPVEAAVEETVVNRNPATSLKLGQARGVVLLAAAAAGLPVHEYAARHIKRALTGTGAAHKEQVAAMVRTLLPGCRTAAPDATDALAVAITHAHHRESHRRIAAGSAS